MTSSVCRRALGWMGGAILCWLAVSTGIAQSPAGLPPEPSENRAAGIPQGFHVIDLSDDRVDAMRRTLAAVGRGLRRRDGAAIGEQFDCFRMVVECRNRGAAVLIPVTQIAAYVRSFEASLGKTLAARADFLAFEEFDIQRCLMSDDNTTAIVLARHVTEIGTQGKSRWWLVEYQDGWKAFDYEEQDVPIRLTDGMVAAFDAMQRGGAAAVANIQAVAAQIHAAEAAVLQEDFYEAERLLGEVDYGDMPEFLRAASWTLRAGVACGRDAYGEALHFARRAEATQRDIPLLSYFRALAFNRMGKHTLARQHAQSYLDQVGDDPDGFVEMAEAQRGLGNPSLAAEFYRKSLAENRNAFDALAGLLLVDGELTAEQINTFLREMDDVEEVVDTICYLLWDRNEFSAIERIAMAFERVAPLNTDVAYYRALVLDHRGEHAEAAAVVYPAISRVADDVEREAFVDLYLEAMLSAGEPVEAYRNTSDKEYAFESLCESLLQKNGASEDVEVAFEAIFAEHQATVPEDPQLAYYRARRLMQQDKPREAGAVLEPVLEQMREHEELGYYVDLYLDAMLDARTPIEGYRHAPDAVYAFEHLASALVYGDDESEAATLLPEVLERHRQNHADDPNLVYYHALWLIQRGGDENWTQAVELLLPALQALAAQEHEELEYYVGLYLDAMGELGRSLEAYAQAPDAKYAFAILAEDFRALGEVDALTRLIAAHEAENADDPWLAVHRARLPALREQWDQAAALLRAARQTVDDVGALQAIDDDLSTALYHLGQYTEAFASTDDKHRVFVSLAGMAEFREDFAALEQIIGIYRRDNPDDPEVAYYTGLLHWLRKEYGQAVDVLTTHRTAIEVATSHGWHVEKLIVYSLIHSGRHEEAIAEASSDGPQDYPSQLLATAHAAAGDVESARTELLRLVENWGTHSTEWLYAEPILSRALRSDAFTQVRRELDALASPQEGRPPSP